MIIDLVSAPASSQSVSLAPALRSSLGRTDRRLETTARLPAGATRESASGVPSGAGDSKPPRKLRPIRFAVGMLLTGMGMAIILTIGMRMIEVRQVGGNFALPLVAIGVLTGVMLLGGGFGVMATSSSGFDESEFDRLVEGCPNDVLPATFDEDRLFPGDDLPEAATQTHRQV